MQSNEGATSDSETAIRVVNLIHFHGLTLWVVENEEIEYVQAKPLSDLAGLAWRMTRKTIAEGDNAILYGTKRLESPTFASEGDARMPPDSLYIRLDRARMFLARISTPNMKAKGKVAAAEALLKLQVEWANAIHAYETKGVAVKAAGRGGVLSLIRARDATSVPGEREALTKMIAHELGTMGYPVAEAQGSLGL